MTTVTRLFRSEVMRPYRNQGEETASNEAKLLRRRLFTPLRLLEAYNYLRLVKERSARGYKFAPSSTQYERRHTPF
jgi:hypothetical protein